VNERRDDTTKPEAESRGGYYYDDATGYEVFSPEEDEADGGGEDAQGGEGCPTKKDVRGRPTTKHLRGVGGLRAEAPPPPLSASAF